MSLDRFLFASGLLWLVAIFFALAARGQGWDQTIWVLQQHPSASDANPGSQSLPLETIQEAVDRALVNKRAERSTRVVIGAGLYRESVLFDRYTNHPSNQPGNSTAMLVERDPDIEPGSVVISGADLWTDWSAAGEGRFTHAWPHDWGEAASDPTGVPPLSQRREMVIVDGQMLRQVAAPEELGPGTFFVDEAADLLTLETSDGQLGNVEVAVRERLWWLEFESNITIRGLSFEHASTPWLNGYGAVRTSGGQNVTFEDLVIRFVNGNGIYLEGEDLTLRRADLSDVGYNAWATFHAKNVLIEDIVANRNNWRGKLTGWASWSVGNKLFGIHGLTLRRYSAHDNFGRGLWLDYDLQDVLIEDIELEGNSRDGIFIEASPGPIVIRRARICGNGEYGILTANSMDTTLDRVTVCDNQQAALMVSGEDDGRTITDWETGTQHTLFLDNWTILASCFAGKEDFLFATTLDNSWSTWLANLNSGWNDWRHDQTALAFRLQHGEVVDFEGFRSQTGEGSRSLFAMTDASACRPFLFVDDFESGALGRWWLARGS